MKHLFFLALFCFATFSCTKENPVTQKATRTDAEAEDRTCSSACSIRIDALPNEVSVINEFRLIREFTTETWIGRLNSLECEEPQNIMDGIWYPITLEEGVQFQVNYRHILPCTTSNLAPCKATISIRTAGSNIKTFTLKTGSTPATNPAIVYFERIGCNIFEGIFN